MWTEWLTEIMNNAESVKFDVDPADGMYRAEVWLKDGTHFFTGAVSFEELLEHVLELSK